MLNVGTFVRASLELISLLCSRHRSTGVKKNAAAVYLTLWLTESPSFSLSRSSEAEWREDSKEDRTHVKIASEARAMSRGIS